MLIFVYFSYFVLIPKKLIESIMRNVSKIFLYAVFLFALNNMSAVSQTIDEQEIVTISGEGITDAYNFKYDEKTGAYCYLTYYPDENKYSISSAANESIRVEYLSLYDVKFDSQGNYYIIGSNYYDTVKTDYILIVNGDSIAAYPYAEQYSTMMTGNDEYKFIITEGMEYKIVTYSLAGGLTESESYFFVKPIYQQINYIDNEPVEIETGENGLFIDKDGNMGYVVSNGTNASIILGREVTETDFYDINNYSFSYDKEGQLTYVAKYEKQFYDGPGRELVVQGDKKYKEFEQVYYPVLFDKNNIPVYTVGRPFIDTDTYITSVIIGNDYQPIYKNSKRIQKGEEYTGGVYNMNVDDENNLTYYGSIALPYTEEMGGDYYGYYSKTSYVVNGVQDEFRFDLGVWKFDGKGGRLVTYSIGDSLFTKVLMYEKDGKEKIINSTDKQGFESIEDYGFYNEDKIYYVGVKYGDYEKRIRDEYSVYLDGYLAGKYELILYQGIDTDYNLMKFDRRGNYAYAVSESITIPGDDYSYQSKAYVVTKDGKQSPIIYSSLGQDYFNYIENLFYSKNDRLFYIGGISDYNNGTSFYQAVVDGTSFNKVYNSISGIKYNEDTNRVEFWATRDNKILKVSINL